MNKLTVVEQDKTLQELQRRFIEDCKILLPEYELESAGVYVPSVMPGEGKEVKITFKLMQKYALV